MFITALTTARHLSLSWTRLTLHAFPVHFLKTHFIFFLHLSLVIPSCCFALGLPAKTFYAPLLSPIHATCPAHLILLNLITRAILAEQYRSLSFSLCNFLHSPVTSSLLCPNILLNTLFSNTLSLRSTLNVSDEVSHPSCKYYTDNTQMCYCI